MNETMLITLYCIIDDFINALAITLLVCEIHYNVCEPHSLICCISVIFASLLILR